MNQNIEYSGIKCDNPESHIRDAFKKIQHGNP